MMFIILKYHIFLNSLNFMCVLCIMFSPANIKYITVPFLSIYEFLVLRFLWRRSTSSLRSKWLVWQFCGWSSLSSKPPFCSHLWYVRVKYVKTILRLVKRHWMIHKQENLVYWFSSSLPATHSAAVTYFQHWLSARGVIDLSIWTYWVVICACGFPYSWQISLMSSFLW